MDKINRFLVRQEVRRILQLKYNKISVLDLIGKLMQDNKWDWLSPDTFQLAKIVMTVKSKTQSYLVISGYRKKLIFSRFKKWIDDMNVLSGFDLTEKLLHELFSDIDAHKKGYLTENDWTNCFLHYDWQ